MNKNNNLLQLLLRLWNHVSIKRRLQFSLLLLLMIISAFTEVVSLGAVLPFVGVLVAPDQVFGHPLAEGFILFFEINSAQELVLPLTIGFIATALVAGTIRVFILWASSRLSGLIGTDLSFEVYSRTLYQPYHIHISRNSSAVISGITGKVNSVVSMVLLPVMIFMSSIFLLVGVSLTLFAIDPFIAIISSVGFSILYVLITFLVRMRLKKNSQRVAEEQTNVVKALQEGLGGIREVLLDGSQNFYSSLYKKADEPLRRAQANNVFVIGSPRLAIETLGIVLLIVLAYVISLKEGGISASLPLIGALAFGAQRLLPALQQCYSGWSTITGNHASLIDVLELLEQKLPSIEQESSIVLPLESFIRIKDLSFRYSSESEWVLSNINLIIPSGSKVGIVGITGSGKSTLLDILMGLISPTEGKLIVDGSEITVNNVKAWQKNISHVPQTIFLSDASINENIAFGVPFADIDFERVKKVAKVAQISEFIEARDENYNALVGERGVRLSGGQRQRIGIARSLYKGSRVLIFDEATSALDNTTEELVISAINNFKKDQTIFFIAHRLTTIKNCDIIIELDKGKLVAIGNYKDLLEKSLTFRKMHEAI